jgi:hypothetical protein
MRERIDTLTSDEVIALIKDVFDEEELNNFNNYIDKNNEKEKAESIKQEMMKLLNLKKL